MSGKVYIYGIQWIDDGGVYDEENFDTHTYDVMEKLGLTSNIVEVCGVHYVDENYEYYGCIKTNVELPEWIGSAGNIRSNPNRYCEQNNLWFYTFELKPELIERFYSLSEFDEIYFGM